ncbi:MAG: hypothetical protein WCT41_01455 [Candidatus Paceibacterota bacterium]
MIIGLDFDDVLVDCQSAVQLFHNRRYGTALTRDDVHTYSLDMLWSCSRREMTKRIDEFFVSPEHEMLAPILGAVEAVRELQSRAEVVVITSRPSNTKPQTRACLMKYFPSLVDSICFARSDAHRDGSMTKRQLCHHLGVQVFVDDAIHYVENVAPVVSKALLFDAPWNYNSVLCQQNMHRVHSWNDILEVVRSI